MHADPKLCQKSRSLLLFSRVGVLAALSMTAPAYAQQVITFDAPNSGAGGGQGTEPSGINLLGVITGDVTDGGGGTHGFVRTPDGRFTEFDVPGANPVPGYGCEYQAGGTCPVAINDFGAIVGSDGDANYVFHGFVRAPEGKIDTFDVPGAGTGAYQGTYPGSINDFGAIAGFYVDSNNSSHGFLRGADGKIVTFDDSAAGSGAYQGTYPESINDFGMVSGWVTDGSGVSHGFVRTVDGKIAVFDPPASVGSPYGLDVAFINDLGFAAGTYFDSGTGVAHGFLRALNGKITEYQIPDAGTGAFDGAFVSAVNVEGTTTGYVTDNNVENHSFVRYADGKVTVFDIPGQILVAGSDVGSSGEGINAAGVVAGRWHDANYAIHGFVWLPK